MRGILGVDPALDRVAAQDDVLLANRERLPRRHEHLLADQVEARHELGHGVLDLDAGVHLHEEVVAVLGQQALDRSRRAVAGGARGVDGDAADPLAQLGADSGRRRLLDELLVAALDRAVALAEVDHVPVRVREHLHLDVSRVLEVPLDVDGRVGEIRLPLPLRGLERLRRLLGRADDLHPLAPAARGGLDQERVADLRAERHDLLGRADRVGRAGDDRHAGRLHRLARARLRAHQLDRGGRRPDPRQARALDGARERGVLREESVAGMYRLRAGPGRRLQQLVDDEIALGRGQPTERVGLVRVGHVRRIPIGVGVDGNRSHTQLAQGAEDPEGDLAPVRNQDFAEHTPYSPDR